jgi:hypothetical protein
MALEKDRDMRYQHASEMRRSEAPAARQRLRPWCGPAGSISDSHPVAVSTGSSGSVAARDVTRLAQHPRHGSSSSVSAVARQHRGHRSVRTHRSRGSGGGCIWYYALVTRSGPLPFQNFTITQITNSGKVDLAAISP